MPPVRLLHVASLDMSLELLLGPQLSAFVEAGYETHVASSVGNHVDALLARGLVHHPLRHVSRSFGITGDIRATSELVRLFRDVRPEIVHTHNPKPGVYGRLAARIARVPYIVNTQHGLYAQASDPLVRRLPVYALERLAAAVSDVELVQSEEDIATLARLGVPSRRLELLGNGIDLARFRPPTPSERSAVRAELGFDDSDVVVGVVGRLVWEKGYAELFDAARRLLPRNPSLRIVVIGPDDPGKDDLLTKADIDRAATDGVEFLGMRADVDRLYHALDLYVLASHREGFPRSAMEAAASGLPVVATDIRGCRQVVQRGVTGLLTPPREPGALAQSIERLVRDGTLRSAMGRAAAEAASASFDQRSVIERTLDAYRRFEPDRLSGVSRRHG